MSKIGDRMNDVILLVNNPLHIFITSSDISYISWYINFCSTPIN